MDTAIEFLLYKLLLLLFVLLHPLLTQSSTISRCFGEADALKWNRTLNFDNRSLVLKIAVTNEPTHWVVNYLFALLAQERLGYRNIEFVDYPPTEDILSAVDQLKCGDENCDVLPKAHLNLLWWTPVRVDVRWHLPTNLVSDLGLLGPVREWRLTTQSSFSKRTNMFSDGLSPCESADYEKVLNAIRKEAITDVNRTDFQGHPMTVLEFQLNETTLESYSYAWSNPPLCGHTSSTGEDQLCRTEAYQAVKLAWAKLNTTSPLLFQLASRMYLTTQELSELLEQVRQSVGSLKASRTSDSVLHTIYRENACRWLRRNPVKWKKWTDGWNHKLNLTIAGLFNLHDKWFLSSFEEAAQFAIHFVNNNREYFRNSEYALKLDLLDLPCESGVVLSEYFNVLADARRNHLVGSLAALCTDSIEAMVELGSLRKHVLISPTVTTARFLEQRYFPYFFRTVPAMTEANFVMLRLFRIWNWRRVAVFRKRDHYYNPEFFEANGIEVIADIQEDENRLSYDKISHTLYNLKERNSRIFIVEYDAIGTYLTLCAAYHLGMHAYAGHVWFLNPWLSSNWWAQPSLTVLGYCTFEEMANITSWTFTVGHQWLLPPMLHSPFMSWNLSPNRGGGESSHQTRTKRQAPDPTDDESPSRQTNGYDPTDFYFIYTVDAVMTLASAFVNLLQQNPSAVSAMDRPRMADTFRNWVSRTEFGYVSRSVANDTPLSKSDLLFGFGFQGSGMFYGVPHRNQTNVTSLLRFNALNERVADHWLLKQHLNNTTVPIYVWVVKPGHNDNDSSSPDTTEHVVLKQPHDSSGQIEALLLSYKRFERQMSMRMMDNVTWCNPAGLPDDGSIEPKRTCAFVFLSETLQLGCTGAKFFLAILLALLALVPVVVAIFSLRRKALEAEKLTRKPFEELCEELADLDMPVEAIVLNRRIGQGAFGLVFGGEAKNHNGCWEAVAVKVINEKATYEGKIDFLSEAKLMRSLQHRNVVRLIGISLGQKENLYLVMELMLLGDLKTYLLSRRILAQRSPDHEDVRPSTLTQMSIDIAQGLAYLHGKHLIHRDIACRNCLVGADHVVKIGDFGLTREAIKNKPEYYYRFTRNCELPIRWMSPEAVQYGIFSIQSDVWSYGITLYEIVTFGVFPYSEMGDVEVVERVKRMEFSIADFLPVSAQNTVIWQLIRECCQHQWKNRPTSMHQVLQVLYDYPECVRPFLTDDPPKPIGTAEQLPFQPSGFESERAPLRDPYLRGAMSPVSSMPAVPLYPLQSSRSRPSRQACHEFGAVRDDDSLGSYGDSRIMKHHASGSRDFTQPMCTEEQSLLLRQCSSSGDEERPMFRITTNLPD